MKYLKICIICSIISIGITLLSYYINDTPHCTEESIGYWSCDILAPNIQKQQICAYNTYAEALEMNITVTKQMRGYIWGECDPTR